MTTKRLILPIFTRTKFSRGLISFLGWVLLFFVIVKNFFRAYTDSRVICGIVSEVIDKGALYFHLLRHLIAGTHLDFLGSVPRVTLEKISMPLYGGFLNLVRPHARWYTSV